MLAECTTSDLIATAQRMRVCVSGSPIETEAGPIPVTVSIGLAEMRTPHYTSREKTYYASLIRPSIAPKPTAGTG